MTDSTDIAALLTSARRESRKWENRSKANYAELQVLRAEVDSLRRDGEATPGTAAAETLGAEIRRLERENDSLRRALSAIMRRTSRPHRAATAPTVKENS